MGTKPNFPPPRPEDFPMLQIIPVEPEVVERNPIEQTIEPDFVPTVWVVVPPPPKKREAN